MVNASTNILQKSIYGTIKAAAISVRLAGQRENFLVHP
jgi:hypothetical protein